MRRLIWLFAMLAIVMAMACSAPASAQSRLSPKAVALAEAQGGARVLVMLQESPHSVQAKAAASPAVRMRLVRAQVDNVLGDVGPLLEGAIQRRFQLVPAVVLHADPALLQRMARHRGVRRIDLDSGGAGHAVAPDAASVLNRVSGLAAQGYAGQGMKVAVIDSGVDTDHADLASSLVAQQCFCSNESGSGGCCPNGAAQQSGAGAAEDQHGHGTNVTGIVLGDGNVAPPGVVPQAALVAVRVLDAANRFCCTSDVIAALDWVAANHPDVDAVNLSLGTDALFAGDCDAQSSITQALAASVDALNAAGAVVTASAGNQSDAARMSVPACVADVMGVGATWDGHLGMQSTLGCTDAATAPRQPTCFSNRSATTDVFAAGAYVTSAGRNGGTSTFAGTSMAAPMVAGCAVALKQAVPASTVAQRMDAIGLSLTRIADPASGRTYPFLDCVDALRLLDPAAWAPIRRNGAQPLLPP